MQLKILTYNILQKPPGVNDVPNEYKDERIKFLIEKTKVFDILLFQEAFRWGNKRYYAMLQEYQKLGFEFFTQCDLPTIQQKSCLDGGIVIISKYKIVESHFKAYDNGIEIESLANIGILYAKIELPKSNIHVFNLHLQAIYEPENFEIKNSCLIQNMKQLLISKKFVKDILDKNFKKGDQTIIGGDFNLDAKEYDYNYKPVLQTFYSNQNMQLNQIKGTYDLLTFILNHNQDKVKFKDLYFGQHSKHDITFGDVLKDENGKELPRETVLTMEEEQMIKQSLDYIFGIQYQNNNLNFEVIDTRVQPFFVENQVFTQVSDHYGISVILSIF